MLYTMSQKMTDYAKIGIGCVVGFISFLCLTIFNDSRTTAKESNQAIYRVENIVIRLDERVKALDERTGKLENKIQHVNQDTDKIISNQNKVDTELHSYIPN